MSLSSLQAQLAALNGSAGQHPGSTYASSKRHEERIGRGLHYSVQHGHVVVRDNNTSHKASLLAATAQEAADVPLQTLHDNCQVALQHLSSSSLSTTTDAAFLLDVRTTIGAANQAPHKTIQELLVYLTTLLAEPVVEDNDAHTSCWHVLEYLLRRYKLHVDHMEDLLWTLLPSAEMHAAMFHRCLQLVDLAAHSSYLWLRPYASDLPSDNTPNKTLKQQQPSGTTTATTTLGNRVPPRQLLAQQVMKRTDLLRRVCRLTRDVADWHNSTTTHDNNTTSNRARPGIAHVLSFTAALVVEGLAWLARQPNELLSREPVLRILFPLVVATCGGTTTTTTTRRQVVCDDWRGWGHVVATVLAETMELAPRTVSSFACHMLQPVLSSSVSLTVQADAVAAVMAVLLPPRHLYLTHTVTAPEHVSNQQQQQQQQQRASNQKTSEACFLPLLNGHVLGCPVVPLALQELVQRGDAPRIVAAALGHLHRDRHYVVAPFCAALVVASCSCLGGDDSTNDADPSLDEDDIHQRHDLVLALIREPGLDSLWRRDPRIDLTASLAAWIVQQTTSRTISTEPPPDDHWSHSRANGILKALHTVDAAACERGIGIGIQELSSHNKDDGDAVRVVLRTLLDGVVPLGGGHADDDDDDDMATSAAANERDQVNFLPPRIAMEHADASVRCQAIERLTLLLQSESDTSSSSQEVVNSQGLLESFFRRLVSDDNLDVAIASCDAISLCLKKGYSVAMNESPRQAAEWMLEASHSWMKEMLVRPTDKKVQQLFGKLLVTSAQVYLAATTKQPGSGGQQDARHLQPLVELIVAHLDNANKEVASHAQKALFTAFDHPVEKMAASKLKSAALKLLIENKPFWRDLKDGLSHRTDKKSLTETGLKRRCAMVMVNAAISSKDAAAHKEDLVRFVNSVCLFFLRVSSSQLSDTELSTVKKGLEWSTKKQSESGEEVTKMMLSLASIGSDDVFQKAAFPTLKTLSMSVTDFAGEPVSPLSVLLEAVSREKASPKATLRLVSMVKTLISEENAVGTWLAVLPTMVLIEHSERRVRDEAMELLEVVCDSLSLTSKKKAAHEWSSLAMIYERAKALKSTSRIGGSSILQEILSSSIEKSKKKDHLRDNLLLLCIYSAVSCGRLSAPSAADALNHGWLKMDSETGGCRVAVQVLNAMESSGEKSFPLLVRWQGFGQPVLSHVLKSGLDSMHGYLDCIVRMLKGTIIPDPTLIISSGPGSAGRRARSYSFGNAGVSVVLPYPKEMSDAIVTVLSPEAKSCVARELSASIANTVLSSTSWQENVFKNLSQTTRRQLARALLQYVASDSSDVSDDLFAVFPLDCSDLLDLLKESGRKLALLSILTDFVRNNSARLVLDSAVSEISMELLDLLLQVGSAIEDNNDVEEKDYAILSLLLALSAMWEIEDSCLALSHDQLKRFLDAISVMLCGSEKTGILNRKPLASARARSMAQKLLVLLCGRYPTEAVPCLIPAILSDIVLSKRTGRDPALAQNTFVRLIPIFLRHASDVKASLHQLFAEFIAQTSCLEHKKQCIRLYHDISHALTIGTSENDTGGDLTAANAATGALIASHISHAINKTEMTTIPTEECDFAADIIAKLRDSGQVASLLLLLQYTKSMITSLQATQVELDITGFIPAGGNILPSLTNILSMLYGVEVLEGRELSALLASTPDRRKLLLLVHAIMKVFADVMMMAAMRRYIRRSERKSASLSLQMWQDLLVLQSVSQMKADEMEGSDDSGVWHDIAAVVTESRDFLQDLLPVPIFLASASSIIEEGGTDEIRSRALRLVAERSLKLGSDSAETALFLDLVPLVLQILEEDQEGGVFLKQSAFIAVEHIARAMKIQSKGKKDREQASDLKHFVSALDTSTRLLQRSIPTLAFTNSGEAHHELICSASLCSAALVRVVGAQCLPFLRKLIDGLVAYLHVANSHLLSEKHCADAEMAQLSILRTLVAVIETVPKFLPPYLKLLLSGSAVLSSSLRSLSSDIAVKSVLDRFDFVISTKVPSRLLVPVATKAMQKSTLAVEMHSLLSIIKVSVDQATNSEVLAQTKQIFLSITTAFQHSGPFEERTALVERACDLLHTLVLKLSEVQLRRLFSSLIEWRGDLDGHKTGRSAEKRHAFWTACGVLSKSLRSIFLPCLGMTMADVVSELETAAACMSRQGRDKVSEGQKRRRLEDAGQYSIEAMRSLQPLLLCLEHSLQADAHQGGNWIRSDDDQKYETLLDPLGKLLQARVPSEFPVEDEVATPYQQLVLGAGPDTGSVVGCLTALAAAGGNEQLWKPLNHAVLEACSNESRSEVRKAGLNCLLSLMKSLGEEYMVLLPECLPVLSELLEDTDEEVCGLSKEIVEMAEELLGESLEDSLR